MKVLIVEDDENKRKRISSFLSSSFPGDEIRNADSVVTGLREAKSFSPDLVVLDMTLPNYSLSSSQSYNPMWPFGGKHFLQKAMRMGLRARIVVMTQFETFGSPPNVTNLQKLDFELKQSFSPKYVGAIYYHASKDAWQSQLYRLRVSLEEGQE